MKFILFLKITCLNFQNFSDTDTFQKYIYFKMNEKSQNCNRFLSYIKLYVLIQIRSHGHMWEDIMHIFKICDLRPIIVLYQICRIFVQNVINRGRENSDDNFLLYPYFSQLWYLKNNFFF